MKTASPGPCRRRLPPGAARCSAARWQRGFTLAEILLAATLGSLLLVATATTAGMFGSQLGYVKQEQDADLEEALTAIADDVRYAWWAEVPDSATLTLADPDGNTTSYYFRKDKLVVVRADGEQGYLLEGLQGGSFSAETIARYREGKPDTRGGTVWSASLPPAAVPAATVLELNDKLCLGLTPTSPAPLGKSLVAGITEQLVDATPTSLTLPIAAISPVLGVLQVELYRARAPNDGRPEGSSLGSATMNLSALPVATSYIWNTKTKKKVKVPKGASWGWWKKNKSYQLIVSAPTTAVSVDLGALKQKIEPGVSYTLQLQVTGLLAGGIAIASAPAASANNSGVALQVGAAGTPAETALAVARSVSGNATITKALASTVVNRVQISLVGTDGVEVNGSVTLTGQGMADDAWLGVIPGEIGE
jgi:prepilin-type N-terminal cleavage/methylation domain-containing protein